MAFIQPPQGIPFYPAAAADSSRAVHPHPHRHHQSAPTHGHGPGRSRLTGHSGIPKRRTKTGCRTCRKRRIKCDEGKPICNNCIKSAKDCLGYDPPQQPGLRSRPAGNTSASSALLPPQIAPAATRADGISPDSLQPAEISPYSSEHLSYGSALPTPQIGEFPGHATLQDSLFPPLQYDFFHQSAGQAPGQHVYQSPEPLLQDSFSHQLNLDGHTSYYPSSSHQSSGFVYDASLQVDPQHVFQEFADHSGHGSLDTAANHGAGNIDGFAIRTQNLAGQAVVPTARFQDRTDSPEQLRHQVLAQPKPTSNPAAFLSQWEDPESPYDVDSDDEQTKEMEAHNQLGMLFMVNHAEQLHKINGLAYYNDKINYLAEYRPVWTSSPLMNPVTARIFGHFVAITGPQLSLMERHPVNPAAFFTNGPVDPRYHSLWSYTLPRLALRNQALLQSMLAVSSLQIARIHKVPSTAARKHFLYATKKLNRDIQNPSKRTDVEAIAATLVIAYYHANRTEHVLWTNVLKGAAQLLSEVKFREQTHRVRAQSAILQAMYMSQADGHARPLVDQNFLVQSVSDGLDENLLSELTGLPVSYAPPEPLEYYAGFAPLTQSDLDKYNAKRDLFWLYCKQDIFQSFITRNPLLLPFKKWINCPPRAPLGRLDAIYGTSDHVMLLCGRVADFIARDQSRKLRVSAQAKLREEQTKREMAKKRHASTLSRTSASSSDKGTPGASSESPMLGMIPNVKMAELPSAFVNSAPRETFSKSPTSDSSSSISLEEAERLALAEWQQIKDALALFEFSLSSPEWQAIPASISAPAYTPFGAPLRFRNYGIANIWLFYYTACIALERAHPDMPPAATVAATLRFQQTAGYVKLIGRIVFGLQVPLDGVSVHPIYGACLSESMLPLFYAGVQLFDLNERHAVIERLRWIATHVGMESAAQVAAGCEATWMALAARMPGLPPWTPVMNTELRHFESTDSLVCDIDDLWLDHSASISGGKQKQSSSASSNLHTGSDPTRHRVRIDRFEGKSFAGGIIGLDDDVIRIGAS